MIERNKHHLDETLTSDSTLVQAELSELTALKKLLFETPLTDAAKIEFIKEELSAGRYEIQSALLAAKLMEHAKPTEFSEMI